MRKQYYFRLTDRGLLAWDVDRLVRLSSELPVRSVPLAGMAELDAAVEGEDARITWRGLIEHMRLIDEADLHYPIILAADGALMDGRHRLARALREGRSEILAVQFAEDPEPDYLGRGPDDLPY
jgi:hypothetical protein